MQKRVSWIVALIIGAVAGVVVTMAIGFGERKSSDLTNRIGRVNGKRPSDLSPGSLKEGQARPTPRPPASQYPAVSKIDIHPDDPARGSKNAKVTLVVFSDFECVFCGRVTPTLKRLEETYGKDLRVVWKHQPLSVHPNAMSAAEAAEAAREQGKFWQMHDLMFAHQQELSLAKYQEWAQQIGLNVSKFRASIESHRSRSRIDENSKQGSSVGANGTPTLFVNCRKIVGAQPYDRFEILVEEELKKADGLAKQGVAIDGKFYERVCDDNLRSAGS